MFSKISVKETTGKRTASEIVLFGAFFFYFLYPFYRDILPNGDLFWALSLVSGLFVCVYKFDPKITIPLSSYFWLILATLALGAFVLLGPDKTVLPKRISLFLVSMLMMIAVSKNQEWIKPAVLACLFLLSIHAFATILLNAFPSLYNRTIAPMIHGSSVTVIGPKAGLTSHYSYNGQLVATGLLLSFALYKMNPFINIRGSRITFGLLACCFAIALLLTTKRTPLLICILAMVIIECLMSRRGKVSAVYKVLCAVFVGGIVVFAFGDQIPAISNAMDRLSALFTADTLEESTTGRTLLWDRAVQLWNDSPLFGFGWGTYRYYWVDGYQGVSSAAHNVFLQLLAEVGVFGLVIFLIPAILVLFGLAESVCKFARRYRESKFESCTFIDTAIVFAFVYQLYFFVYCFVGAPLYDFESFPVYFVLSCGIWYSVRESKTKDRAASFPWISIREISKVNNHD